MTKAEIILNLLRISPRTNWELTDLAKTGRVGARIYDLRKSGYEIDISREGLGRFRYTLIAEPKPVKIAPLPVENQMELL